MNFHFRDLKSEYLPKRVSSESSSLGFLRIEVPHWETLVQVFDESFHSLAQPEVVRADTDAGSNFTSECELLPGVYLIRVELSGKTQELWVPVQPDKITYVEGTAWGELQFTSVIPAPPEGRGGRKRERAHVASAEKNSREKTWKESNGDSSLFVFIRSTETKRSEHWASGLQLLTGNGNPIPEFGINTKKSNSEGWLAFNADLPEGGYILRQGRRGVRLRYQVIHLCRGWQTQVFIKSKRSPALKFMSLSMSKRGQGFRPDDESDIAAEAILKSLRYKSNLKRIFKNHAIRKNLDHLIDEKHGNPWLGVLAAHAIRRLKDELLDLSATSIEAEEDLYEYLEIYEQKIIPFLTRKMPSHPDVQSLLLDAKPSHSYQFVFPPSLWISLRLVQKYAAMYADTIPKDCLTDCVLDTVMSDSPWTGWRFLNRTPSGQWEGEANESKGKLSSSWNSIAVKKTEPVYGFDPYLFASHDTPVNLPPYNAQTSVPREEHGQTTFVPTSDDLKAVTVNQQAKDLALEYIVTNGIEKIPSEIAFDSAKKIGEILENVNPSDVSQAYNLPLSRTEYELENLKQQVTAQPASDASSIANEPEKRSASEIHAQNAILDFAIKSGGIAPELSTLKTPQVFDESAEEYEGGGTTRRVAELSGKIRSCAERLWTIPSGMQSSVVSTGGLPSEVATTFSSQQDIDECRAIASRLKTIGDELLGRANFVALTDASGRIFDKNDAFLQLLLPRDLGVQSPAQLVESIRDRQTKWEQALGSLPVSTSQIDDPNSTEKPSLYQVKRSIIKDEANDAIHAHVNILSTNNFEEADPQILDSINTMLPDLILYSSLFAYGSGEDKQKYRLKLDDKIALIEETIKHGLGEQIA